MSVRALAVFLAASFSAMGGSVTIAEVSGGTSGCECNPGLLPMYVSWTQTGTFTSVNIFADLGDAVDPAATGVAYLTNQVGLGTTQASNGLGITPFNISITNTIPQFTLLFSGLTLGPGTYNLVIVPTDSLLGWESFTTSPTVTTASGVTLNSGGDCFSTNSCSLASYPPASSVFLTKTSNAFLYKVTGATSGVPEPATAGLMLAALGVGALLLRKRSA